jgi:hypothetical protein
VNWSLTPLSFHPLPPSDSYISFNADSRQYMPLALLRRPPMQEHSQYIRDGTAPLSRYISTVCLLVVKQPRKNQNLFAERILDLIRFLYFHGFLCFFSRFNSAICTSKVSHLWCSCFRICTFINYIFMSCNCTFRPNMYSTLYRTIRDFSCTVYVTLGLFN